MRKWNEKGSNGRGRKEGCDREVGRGGRGRRKAGTEGEEK